MASYDIDRSLATAMRSPAGFISPDAMVSRAVAFSFDKHHVDRIDLGVDALNVVAINCYRRQGFKHVGTWPQAMEAGPTVKRNIICKCRLFSQN